MLAKCYSARFLFRVFFFFFGGGLLYFYFLYSTIFVVVGMYAQKTIQIRVQSKKKKKEFVPKDIKYTWISQLYSIHAPRLRTSNHSNETI